MKIASSKEKTITKPSNAANKIDMASLRKVMKNNSCPNIHIQQGKIDEVKLTGKFDIILANINKNILLLEMHHYASYLEKGGLLFLSGFYTYDIEDLKRKASNYRLNEIAHDERETWACLLLLT